jgi:hypothetical protein
MSDEESNVINEREHDAMLNEIRNLDRPSKRKSTTTVKPVKKKVAFNKASVLDDLVGEITSTRYDF